MISFRLTVKNITKKNGNIIILRVELYLFLCLSGVISL